MAEIAELGEAVEELASDGDSIPFDAVHEVMRRKRRDLTLIRMTPDLVYDQMIGAGCAGKLVFSWGEAAGRHNQPRQPPPRSHRQGREEGNGMGTKNSGRPRGDERAGRKGASRAA